MQSLLWIPWTLTGCVQHSLLIKNTSTIKDLIFNRLINVTKKDLKFVDKDSIWTLINHFKQFLPLGLTDQEAAQIIETT